MPAKTGQQRTDLQCIWNLLLNFARYKQVPVHDAGELVNESLRKGLERYDNTRGELLPFCRTILANAIKNYWRDRKIDLPLPPDVPDDWGPDRILEEKERIEAMNNKIQKLITLLSPQEHMFFTALAEVLEELEDRAVSEASRRLGLSPEAGWNINRRIKRKAEALVKELSLKEVRQVPLISDEVAFERIIGSSAKIGKHEAPCASRPAPVEEHVVAKTLKMAADETFVLVEAFARQQRFERFLQSL